MECRNDEKTLPLPSGDKRKDFFEEIFKDLCICGNAAWKFDSPGNEEEQK